MAAVHPTVPDPRQRAATILVFGAAVGADGPSDALRARIGHAAELYAAGRARRVICAGRPEEIASMRALFAELGVGGTALAELRAANTRETVIALREMLGSASIVLAVSSPYHLPRVQEEARRCGLRIVACASPLAEPPSGLAARLPPPPWPSS